MSTAPDRIPAFQLNAAGLLVDVVPALESIAQPSQGIYHVPGGAVIAAMPDGWISTEAAAGGFFDWQGHWPDDKWPRFNGHAWELVTRPVAPAQAAPTPVEKLAAFLAENPDVSALINATTTPSA
jgi:hypothetical protein